MKPIERSKPKKPDAAKPEKKKRVRRDRWKERCEVIESRLASNSAEREKLQAESSRVNAASQLVAAMLTAERAELAARIAKADVFLRALGASPNTMGYSEASPSYTVVTGGW